MVKIEAVIDEYINSTAESAIMIDGEWGSGKTYFVKNVLIKKPTLHPPRSLSTNLRIAVRVPTYFSTRRY